MATTWWGKPPHVVATLRGLFWLVLTHCGAQPWSSALDLRPWAWPSSSILALSPGAQVWNSDLELSPGARLWSSALPLRLEPHHEPKKQDLRCHNVTTWRDTLWARCDNVRCPNGNGNVAATDVAAQLSLHCQHVTCGQRYDIRPCDCMAMPWFAMVLPWF